MSDCVMMFENVSHLALPMGHHTREKYNFLILLIFFKCVLRFFICVTTEMNFVYCSGSQTFSVLEPLDTMVVSVEHHEHLNCSASITSRKYVVILYYVLHICHCY